MFGVHSDAGEPKVLRVPCHCYAVINFIFEIFEVHFIFSYTTDMLGNHCHDQKNNAYKSHKEVNLPCPVCKPNKTVARNVQLFLLEKTLGEKNPCWRENPLAKTGNTRISSGYAVQK